MASRSKSLYVVLSIALLLSGVAAVIYAFRNRPVEETPPSAAVPEEMSAGKVEIPTLDDRSSGADPITKVGELGIGPVALDPAELVTQIGRALEEGNFEKASALVGKQAWDERTVERLRSIVGGGRFKLRQPPVREVGELERNELMRWALELDSPAPGGDRIYLDLRRKDGTWSVEKLALARTNSSADAREGEAFADSLEIADAFLQAVLGQNFQRAKEFVDSKAVSDAKIAGLCILFEEGDYRLRSEKPLRSLIARDHTAGYLANVTTPDGGQAAQFSLMVRREDGNSAWKVSEVNLDQLLEDYARRFADGDAYYTPLVKNPKGGDTLVLYFDFDEDQLGERTQRQLKIVAEILQMDAKKKLTLSGHTDAVGAEQYNEVLSGRRATVVKEFLVAAGVSADQIVTVAKGMSQPRRANFTETGEDNPEGRRVNRRTEIYLDF